MPDLTPITREEMFLDGNTELTPITREEKILAGEDIDVITRREWFLKKYRSGGDITVEPITITENGTTMAPSGKAYSPIYTNVGLPENAYLLKDFENVPSDIVTFNDGANLPMPSLKTTIVPIQDLHGYDSPWVGGAGKNKLQISATSQSLNGVTFTVNDDGTVNTSNTATGTFSYTLFSGSLTFAQDVIINGCPENGSLSSYALTINNGATTETGSGITIPANTEITAIAIKIANGTNMNGKVFKPMIRLASVQDDTFAPYSNICPISGWDEANVSDVGKNLVNISDKTMTTLGYVFAISGLNIRKGMYTFSAKTTTSASMSIAVYGNGVTFINTGFNGKSISFNATDTITDIRLYTSGAGTFEEMMLEEGSEPTTYEPYNGHTYTINFTDSQGNPIEVFGGECDVVNGGGSAYKEYDSYNGEILIGPWISDRDVYAPNTSPTIGAQVVDMGDTSTFISQPTSIKSLEGTNNVWGDCGQIKEGSYFAKSEEE